MAIKMAKGSLFAYLLRSPWWYSAIIGSVVVAISLAITEGQYIALSVAGALPFWGIGGYSAYKQSQRPSAKRVSEVTELAKTLGPAGITQKIVDHYTSNQFQIQSLKARNSETFLLRGHRKLLLNTKRFKAAKTGVEPLKVLVATGEKSAATGYLYVALGEVTDTARAYAQQNRIEIIDASRLAALFDGKAKIE